jgi:hypothetical protein
MNRNKKKLYIKEDFNEELMSKWPVCRSKWVKIVFNLLDDLLNKKLNANIF